MVSIIVPSLDGHRGGAVAALLRSIEQQTYANYEIVLVKGVAPQGKAINEGASRAQGDVVLIMDDDARMADETVLQRLVDTLAADPRIAMAGASILPPPESTPFQRRASEQFPRFSTPVVDEITDSDFACHGCCALPKSVFNEVGREREDLLRGLDPDLRFRLREAGYRVVLAPNARVYHPMPPGWNALVRTFFRNGFGSAYARKFHPETVFETHESLDDAKFRPRSRLGYRILRFPMRLGAAVLTGRLIRFGAYCSYAVGYGWGYLTAKEYGVERQV